MLQKYLSDFENFDGSESVCSETTVASEDAERELAFYNEGLVEENAESNSNAVQVVNLHVDAVNVFGDKNRENQRDELPLEAINNIINTQKTSTEGEWKTIRRNNYFFGVLITCMTGIIFISFVGILIKHYDTSEISEKFEQSISVIPKSKWVDDVGRISSERLKTPVSKVIIFDTLIESCEQENCIKKFWEESFYPKFEDVRENFLISANGTIFEGRGFSHVGDVQVESSFGILPENDAISINILCNKSNSNYSDFQLSSLQEFLKKALKENLLASDFYWILKSTDKQRKIDFFEKMGKDFEEIIPKNYSNTVPKSSFEDRYNSFHCKRAKISVIDRNDIMDEDITKHHFLLKENATIQIKSLNCFSEEEGLTESVKIVSKIRDGAEIKALTKFLIANGNLNKFYDRT